MARVHKDRVLLFISILVAAFLVFFAGLFIWLSSRELEVKELSLTGYSEDSAILSFLLEEPSDSVSVIVTRADSGEVLTASEFSGKHAQYAKQYKLDGVKGATRLHLRLGTSSGGFTQDLELGNLGNTDESIARAVNEPTSIFGLLTDYNSSPVQSGANLLLKYKDRILASSTDAKGIWSVELTPILNDILANPLIDPAVAEEDYLELQAVSQLGEGKIQIKLENVFSNLGQKFEVKGLRIGQGAPPESLIFNGHENLRLNNISTPTSNLLRSSLTRDIAADDPTVLPNTPAAQQAQGSGTCAGQDTNGDGIAESADPALCQVNFQCNWRNGWFKKCLEPFTGDAGNLVKHEWVAYCNADGSISANIPSGAPNLYSQINSNCTAERIGQKVANAELNDACDGDITRMRSDPGGCAVRGITEGEDDANDFFPITFILDVGELEGFTIKPINGGTPLSVNPKMAIDVQGETNNPRRIEVGIEQDAPQDFFPSEKLKVTFGYYLPTDPENFRVMYCATAQASVQPANLGQIPLNELLLQSNPATEGWSFPESWRSAGESVTVRLSIANCMENFTPIEVPLPEEIVPEPPADGGSSGGGGSTIAGISSVLSSGVCPIHPEDITKIRIYQDSDGPGSHATPPISTQLPTDIGLSARSCGGSPCTTRKLRDDNLNIRVVSPVRARVVEIRNPAATVSIYGGGICQNSATGAAYNPNLPFGNVYIGGMTVILKVLDANGNELETIRLNHIEAIQQGISEQTVLSQGQLIGYIYDGLLGDAEAGASTSESAYSSSSLPASTESGGVRNGCFDPNNPHLHFALIQQGITARVVRAGEGTNPLIGEHFDGNTLDSTRFIREKCFGEVTAIENPENPENPGSPEFDGVVQSAKAQEKLVEDTRFRPPTPGGYTISVNGRRTNVPEIIFSDTNQEIRYFVDSNNDGLKQTDERYLSDNELSGLEIKFASTGSLFNYQLERGWNLVGLPFANENLTSASKLYDAIVTDLRNVTPESTLNLTIAAQNSASNYELYTKAYNSNSSIAATGLLEVGRDFGLVPGRGVFIYTAEPMHFNLSGNSLESGDYPALWSGWNMLNLWKNNEQKSNDVLISGLEDKQVHEIARYRSGRFISQQINEGQLFGENFLLDPKKSYFVRVD